MAGAQIRISESTHRLLRSLASETNESMQNVVEKAVEHYRRKSFLEGVNDDFRVLQTDESDWQDELNERVLWNNTFGDGLEK